MKSSLSSRDTEELRGLLQDAAIKCSERCLYQAAKWAAELLNSLPTFDDTTSFADTEPNSPTLNAAVSITNHDPIEAKLEAAELPRYLMAKTLFDCREFDRCAAVFLPITMPKASLREQVDSSTDPTLGSSSQDGGPAGDAYPNLSQKALFLALYAKYLSGEKRKDEDREIILGPSDVGTTVNKELPGLNRVLEARLMLQESQGTSGQGWLEYLYGVVLAKGKNDAQAKEWLIRSVQLYSYNWSAWQELCQLLNSAEEYEKLYEPRVLPQNIISFIFHVYASQELFQVTDDVFRRLKQAKAIFPASSFLRTQKALLHYHSKDFEHAERTFSKLLAIDPLRLDSLDAYSNILYVMEKRPKLAFLAQLASSTDKFRPETCCIVGNYYAMKSEHEKAVVYFRRALTLDPNFLSAWTLMGHEYVEMKNTQAAIECYRRAVDVQRKDYRAWYGLGQTYEMLDMGFYALFYYQRAAALSPLDPKMWSAVGACLAKMARPEQAVKAFKRALAAGSYYENGEIGTSFASSRSHMGGVMDPDILYNIAEMYDRLCNDSERKIYLELVLAQEEGAGVKDDEEEVASSVLGRSHNSNLGSQGEHRAHGVGVTSTTSRARLWLAKIEMAEAAHSAGTDHLGLATQTQSRDKLQRALDLATELCQDGFEVEEAKGLVREIRSRLENA